MITQWHDPKTTPLPPVGTRILVYHPDLAHAAPDLVPWQYGIEAGVVTYDEGKGSVAETRHSLHYPSDSGWRWAFAPNLPEIPEGCS